MKTGGSQSLSWRPDSRHPAAGWRPLLETGGIWLPWWRRRALVTRTVDLGPDPCEEDQGPVPAGVITVWTRHAGQDAGRPAPGPAR